MLSTSAINRLKSLGIEASSAREFVTGLRLMQLVIQALYKGQNRELSSKIRLGDQQKTGNNVLNVNIILNHLKRDPNIIIDDDIRDLTAFKLIQQEEQMKKLIEWILSKYTKYQQLMPNNQIHSKVEIFANQQMLVKEEMSPPRQQQNQFQNLYFVSSLQKKSRNLDDSLNEDNPQEKVVRKGSFKVLKPKITTDSKTFRDENRNIQLSNFQYKLQQSKVKEPLRQLVLIQKNSMQQNEDREDLNCRKTVPKMSDKPPLYRSKHKQQKYGQGKQDKKQASVTITQRPTDRQSIIKNIQNINKQIAEQERSLQLNAAQQIKPQKRSRRTSRKIFKIDIPETQQNKKRNLLQWLITINLLNSSAAKFVSNLQTICKDGVIFLEIINYYRGRGKQMCYFKEPKRSAEIHSNYQKLFAALGQQPQFRSNLIHQYQYFIPEAQPNAFWSLLSSIYQSFNKRVQTRENSINRYQNSINRKVEKETSKKQTHNQQISYHEIKYNSSSIHKQVKSGCSSVQYPRKQTPKPKSRQQSLQSQKSDAKLNVPYGLIQNQQPVEQIFRTERGYKEMYLCKFKNMQTPQKNKSFHNSFLSKSRIKGSIGSSKKKELKPVVPSISLEMQMKVLTFLQFFQADEDVQQLFRDPYRNGALLCQVVQKVLGVQCYASRKPKNIDDCRNNFLLAIQTIKANRKDFNINYQFLIEELVKGQRSLLFGIIWQLIRSNEKQSKLQANFQSIQLQGLKQASEELAISWIRSVQRSYPQIGEYKIRNQSLLYGAIVNTDFLFHYSWFITGKKAITPTYQRPVNDIQKQSNLKKVLGYLVQSKIIRSDYLWKSKLLVKREQSLLKQFVMDLINHFNHLYKKQQIKSVNFVKYLKRQDSQSRQKPQERLQTTMANQTLTQNNQVQPEQPKVEVGWMRKMGFSGSLQMNNGVVLCRLMAKLNMKTIQGFNQHPQSRAECLGNIRRAIKDIPKFRWDEYDILECDHLKALQIYAFLKDRYKHAYAMKGI